MIAPPPGVRVWLAAGVTDMRKGFDGLAALVQQTLSLDPFSGQIFAFRGRRGDLAGNRGRRARRKWLRRIWHRQERHGG